MYTSGSINISMCVEGLLICISLCDIITVMSPPPILLPHCVYITCIDRLFE